MGQIRWSNGDRRRPIGVILLIIPTSRASRRLWIKTGHASPLVVDDSGRHQEPHALVSCFGLAC